MQGVENKGKEKGKNQSKPKEPIEIIGGLKRERGLGRPTPLRDLCARKMTPTPDVHPWITFVNDAVLL